MTKPKLNWFENAVEERLPLSDRHPVWVRHGVVRSDDAPTLRPHCHANCEIGIWFEGQGHHLSETEKCLRKSGDLYLAGPGVTHAARISRYPLSYATVHFLPSLLIELGPDVDGLRALRRFTACQSLAQQLIHPPPRILAQFSEIFRNIAQEWDSKRIGREFQLRKLVLELLVLLLRWEEESGRQVGAEEKEVDWRPVARALAHIREHYTNAIYSHEVAKVAGVSESRLKAMFRESLGMTWVKYLQLYRIHQAASLMSGAHRNVTEAAFAVGFESLSHFNSVFQECMGVSPKQWLRRPAKFSTDAVPVLL